MNKFLRNAGDGAFDPDAVRILTTAFDEAWRSLQTTGVTFASRGHAEAAREILATRIIEEAKLGELNKVRLRDDALAHLAHHLRNLPRRGQP